LDLVVIATPKAVLFDLFNTLIPGGTTAERDATSARMGALLGVDQRQYAVLFRATFDERTRGRLGDLRQTTTMLARQLGAAPLPGAVSAAVQVRLDLNRGLQARTWAVPALAALREMEVPCALVSDCSAETTMMWPTSPLAPYMAATSFSCVTGYRKPAAEAYLTATDALGVRPGDCWFVGDGGSRELSGAEALGMTAIRYIPSADLDGESIDGDADWSGPTVTDLLDIVSRIG
jgi:putative hydrolase of the HAD superfamily